MITDLGIKGVTFNAFQNEKDTNALNKLTGTLSPGCVAIEIGTREGYSASITARNVEKAGGCLYVVDPWETLDVFRKFRDNMKLMNLTVYPLVMKSVDAARIFKDGVLDFIFIDGDHTYDCVKDDITSWLPKLKPSGIMAGHDYKPNAKGVMEAVDEMFGDDVTVFPDTWIWYGYKRYQWGQF